MFLGSDSHQIEAIYIHTRFLIPDSSQEIFSSRFPGGGWIKFLDHLADH